MKVKVNDISTLHDQKSTEGIRRMLSCRFTNDGYNAQVTAYIYTCCWSLSWLDNFKRWMPQQPAE